MQTSMDGRREWMHNWKNMQEEVQPRNLSKALRYAGRAVRLKCPVCGTKPIFPPLKSTCNLHDWFTPLDGCPRCGYPYEREPGYFLMSIWALNYGFGCIFGIALYFFLEWKFHLPIGWLLVAVVGPVLLFNFLFVRHSKAFFLAFDHFWDPHEKEGGDDGGNQNQPPPPSEPSPPQVSPSPDPEPVEVLKK